MHVIDSLAVGGAERMLVDIVNTLDSLRFAASVCITRNTTSLVTQLKPAIPFTVLERKHIIDINGFIKLKNFSQTQRTDLFHAHGRSTFSFLCVARMLGFISGPIILHDHFGEIETNKRVPAWFPLLASRYLAHYIGVCNILGEWAICAGVDNENITVIENAIDLSRLKGIQRLDIRSRLGIPEDQKICLMVGNLRPAKGLDLLIEACTHIPRDQLPIFVVVGKEADFPYTQICREKIRANGLDKHFYFAGQQNDSIAWMKGSDLAVMPSRTESGPLVLIEYLASSLPFVAFNVGGISRQISQVFPDQFSDPENVEMFALALRNLLKTDTDELNIQARRYKALAWNMFDIQSRMPVLESIYTKVLKTSK